MKKIFVPLMMLLSPVIIIFFSCKKEISCEGCATKSNKPPISVAGPDQLIILPADSVLLDGRTSSDPDGKISSYLWTKISGPVSFNITKPSDSATKVKALVVGTYLFELKVTDNGGLSAKDTVQVIVEEMGNNTGTTSLGCNVTMSAIATLPTPGSVRYSVAGGTKVLFMRGNGAVDIYDTLMHAWQTINGMYATSNYMNEQVAYKTAKAGSKIIFSAMTDELDPSQGQLINIYDFVSDSWTITHLSQARLFYAMAVVGYKVYYAGGNNDSKKMDIYDAASGSWSVTDFNEARSTGMTAIAYGNKIFFAGGSQAKYDSLVWVCDEYGMNCDSVPAIVSSDRVDVLDVSTNTWSVLHLSEAKSGISVAILNNKIVFAGGEKLFVINSYFTGSPSTVVDFYNTSDNSWLTHNLGAGNTIIADYNIYSIGTKLLIPNGGGSNKIQIYDDNTNSWSVAYMPFPHETDMWERGLVTVSGNKLLFFLQYIQDPSHSRGIDVYNALTDTWCHTQLNFDLIRTSIVTLGNKTFVAGGFSMIGCCSYNTLVDTVWHLKF